MKAWLSSTQITNKPALLRLCGEQKLSGNLIKHLKSPILTECSSGGPELSICTANRFQDTTDAASQECTGKSCPLKHISPEQGLNSTFPFDTGLQTESLAQPYLQQLLGEVPTILKAIQVGNEFLAAHALSNVLWPWRK
jgi:hypothetical protein